MYHVEAAAQHPELVSTVGRWHWAEWGHADPSGSVESWTQRLQRSASTRTIPMLLLALAGTVPVGSVVLVEHDMNPDHERWGALTPWLAGLFVVPEYRRRGIGSMLIRACEREARTLGVGRLHLYTGASEGLYRKHGYRVLGHDSYEGEAVVVMAKDLFQPSETTPASG
jgi:GNAT superfamily N-acetyltransferase